MSKGNSASKYLPVLMGIVIAGFVLSIVIVLTMVSRNRQGALDPEERRELASRLMGVGLADEATAQYERYLDEARIGSEAKSKIAFSVGKAFQDQGNLARALTWYYQAEILDPKSPLKAEIGSRVVECLEKLGKYQAATYALGSRSGMDSQGAGEKKGGKVVAKIGDRSITLSEVDEALDKMPEWMRNEFQGPGKKAEFLQQYVSNELLYEKAVRLGYERDPEIQKQVDLLRKQLLVNRVLADEIQGKVDVTDSDVDLYYRANQGRYVEPASARLGMIKLSDRLEAEKARQSLRKGADFAAAARDMSLDENTREKGGEVPYPVRKGQDSLGLGKESDGELWKLIDETAAGGITEVLSAGEHLYIFKIREKSPERQRALSEVAEQVRQDMTREKMGQRYQELMKSMLESETVQLFPEVLQDVNE